MYPDQDLAKQPVAHSVEIPLLTFNHLEELPEDEFYTSTVDRILGQSDIDFEGT